jgi:DDE superfamily endonuclease
VQATVDHEKRFTSFDLGWPGSVPDVTVFKASYIWTNRVAHFSQGEYLLADKGETNWK